MISHTGMLIELSERHQAQKRDGEQLETAMAGRKLREPAEEKEENRRKGGGCCKLNQARGSSWFLPAADAGHLRRA
jgi:hypothetical protein